MTVENSCRIAAQQWQHAKDAAQAALAALPPREDRLPVEAYDQERYLLEQRVHVAGEMVKWFLSDETRAFVASVEAGERNGR